MPHVPQRVYTVGRLDEGSEGLLLLTNDGELAHRLMHPRYGVEKTYLVQVAGSPTRDDLDQLLKGVWLSDGHVHARRVTRLRRQGDSTFLEIVLSEGKNREVRRMLARLGHKVMRLKRMALGRVRLGRLASGKARPLGHAELESLRRAADRNRQDTAPDGSEKPRRVLEPATTTSGDKPRRPPAAASGGEKLRRPPRRGKHKPR